MPILLKRTKTIVYRKDGGLIGGLHINKLCTNYYSSS